MLMVLPATNPRAMDKAVSRSSQLRYCCSLVCGSPAEGVLQSTDPGVVVVEHHHVDPVLGSSMQERRGESDAALDDDLAHV